MGMASKTKSTSGQKRRSSASRPGQAGVSHGGRVSGKGQPASSGRYTRPIPRQVRRSPTWMMGAILGPIALGFLMIILNYAKLLPGSATNWYLLGGLVLIFGGGMIATRYH